MADALLVQVVDALEQLLHNVDDCGLFECLTFFSTKVFERSMTHILHHDVNVVFAGHDLKDTCNFRVINEFQSRILFLLQLLVDLVSFLKHRCRDFLYTDE